MNTHNTPKTGRIELVDALRGFALLAIVLIHNVEHYNVMGAPADTSTWMAAIDAMINDAVFFMFGGKAYAIFSFMFGLSFYIQMRNARKRGCDYRLRWVWRMVLLAIFAQLHAMFYNGDILLFYAVCGLILIPASGWKDRTVLIVASLLMMQPWAWCKIVYAAMHPGYVDLNNTFTHYYPLVMDAARNGDFIQTVMCNLRYGQLYSNYWQVEAGRLFQAPALFLLGMLAGRRNLFEHTAANTGLWSRIGLYALTTSIPLYLLKTIVPEYIYDDTIRTYYGVAIPMLFNFAFTLMLISGFTLLWFSRSNGGYSWQRMLIPYGRMSLTNYIFQSVIGVTLYYHYGLCLYDKVGATLSVMIGIGIFALQLAISQVWLRTHRQGPLEYIWKRLTWINF